MPAAHTPAAHTPAAHTPADDAQDEGAKAQAERAASILAKATDIAILTGAGISTDSGIPDFRGPDGVWTKNPAAERTSRIADYVSDPEVRRQSWQNRLSHPTWLAVPNSAHHAITDLHRQGRLLAVLTQNIDGLHQRAGLPPQKVVELHGTMWNVVCLSCHRRTPMATALERVRAGEADPPCEVCGGILKSDTISFGQALDPLVLEQAAEVACNCDVMLAVGSTLSVHPAAGYVPIALHAGAAVIIVNAQATAYDHLAHAVVRGQIGEIVPELLCPTS